MRDKNPKLFPDYDAARADMARETTTFGRHVLLDGDGRLETLLSAPFSFVNARLAKIYGLPEITGSELQRVALPSTERAGAAHAPKSYGHWV